MFYIAKKINEVTPIGTKIIKSVVTIKKWQTTLNLPVYVSNKEDPKYTDEPGCKKIGTVDITIPNPSEDILHFDVEFHFGHT